MDNLTKEYLAFVRSFLPTYYLFNNTADPKVERFIKELFFNDELIDS